jgi:hypothetical protein
MNKKGFLLFLVTLYECFIVLKHLMTTLEAIGVHSQEIEKIKLLIVHNRSI